LAAAASASLFIVTKYGLVRVLRMRDTPTVWPVAGADPLGAELLEEPWGAGELEELEELQAASAAVAQSAAAAYIARR
jgi:hypothetical protein